MSALFDTLLPAVHDRLVLSYIRACGGCIGVVAEPPWNGPFPKNPLPWFDVLFGAFRYRGVKMAVGFDKL